mmetsp:Transcript_46912/g.84589  ORF Transcript_46912/g.84589 Transcript_46912/m.84589 type:complete len:89 (-) Transcript_46912:23-289(-)
MKVGEAGVELELRPDLLPGGGTDGGGGTNDGASAVVLAMQEDEDDGVVGCGGGGDAEVKPRGHLGWPANRDRTAALQACVASRRAIGS